MEKRRHISWLLILVSMLVLIVPVLPHHHHNGEEICFLNDENPGSEHHQEDPDCEGYCVTKLHFSVQHHNYSITQLQDFPVFTLFSEDIQVALLPPKLKISDRLICFSEPLYGSGFHRLASLRAPPAI